MATYRGQGQSSYSVGSPPPYITWTIVKGDTAAFKVYVADDAGDPINLGSWNIAMEIRRPNTPVVSGQITDNATTVLTLAPSPGPNDGTGEFTVSLTSALSGMLRTDDIFDIELSTADDSIVWTVGQGKMIVLEDVTP